MTRKRGEDLKKRTKQLAITVIRLVEKFPHTTTANILGGQLIRSSTSVGSNYRASCRAKSRADFISKMGTVEEETDETLYWLEILLEINFSNREQAENLLKEYDEILAIVVASIKTAKSNMH